MARGNKPFIVIVEDEVELSSMIQEQLEQAHMEVQVFNDCDSAYRFLSRQFANLLLLDVSLPQKDGFTLFQELKRSNIQVPVVFLTGNDAETDVVKGLEMGGDDYIIKPFGFPELIARIQAVLRRTERLRDFNVTQNASLSDQEFAFCGAQVSPQNMEITFLNKQVEKIGRKELGILLYMVKNAGTVLTRKSIIHSVWGLHADVRSRSLDQYIVKIRDAFSRNDCELKDLRTVHGVGYVYDPAVKSEADSPSYAS